MARDTQRESFVVVEDEDTIFYDYKTKFDEFCKAELRSSHARMRFPS